MLLGITLLVGCREATQITIQIQTDADCSKVTGTLISVGRLDELDGRPASSTTVSCDPSTGRIGALVLVPSSTKSSEIAFSVVTGIGLAPDRCADDGFAHCIVSKRALRFIPHQPLTVKIDMRNDCVGVTCPPRETCVKGQCVPALIDPGNCEKPEGCDEGDLGTGGPPTTCTPQKPLKASISTNVPRSPALVYEPVGTRWWLTWFTPSAGTTVYWNGVTESGTLSWAFGLDGNLSPSPSGSHTEGTPQIAMLGEEPLIVGASQSGGLSYLCLKPLDKAGKPLFGVTSPCSSAVKDARPLHLEGLTIGTSRWIGLSRIASPNPSASYVDMFVKATGSGYVGQGSLGLTRSLSSAWNESNATFGVASSTLAGGTVRLLDATVSGPGKTVPFTDPVDAPLPNLEKSVSIAAANAGFTVAWVGFDADVPVIKVVHVDAGAGTHDLESIMVRPPDGGTVGYPRVLRDGAFDVLAWLETGADGTSQVMLRRLRGRAAAGPVACITCGLPGTTTDEEFGFAQAGADYYGVALRVTSGSTRVQNVVPIRCGP